MIYSISYFGLTIGSLVAKVNKVIINPLIIFIFSLALLMFFFGMVKFLANRQAASESSNDGKRHMLWGIVGMAIMVSVFGIVNFIANTLGVEDKIKINDQNQNTTTQQNQADPAGNFTGG